MKSGLLLASVTVGCLLAFSSGVALAQDPEGEDAASEGAEQPTNQLPAFVGTSPRLDELPEPVERSGLVPGTEEEIKNRGVPFRKKPPGRAPLRLERLLRPTAPLAVELLSKFDGLRQGNNYRPAGESYPPDANGSVSPHWYFQWVNSAFAKFDKNTGKMMIKPRNGNLIWRGLVGSNCAKHNDGDPVVIYDKNAGRWLLTQFIAPEEDDGPFAECLAISKTEDPTGQYYLFEFNFPVFNDYPKFGIWRDGYYASFNMFPDEDESNTFAKVCAFDRDKMLSDDEAVRRRASMQCFDPKDEHGRAAWGVLPADIDGTNMPEEGSPEYVLGYTVDALLLWRIHVDWTNPKRSKISRPVVLKVDPFEEGGCLEGNQLVATCIPQKGTPTKLDALGSLLMYRLSYRNFGDRESLFTNHTVNTGRGFGIRWYELSRDLPATKGSQFKVRQQQTYAPDNGYRWLGSMASDKMGNVLVVYNRSDRTSHPSLVYAGRQASDPLSQLSVEGVVAKGERSVAGDRWGDYGSVSVDPTDDCTFWATGQYMAGRTEGPGIATATPAAEVEVAAARAPIASPYNWDTVVASFKFPGCH